MSTLQVFLRCYNQLLLSTLAPTIKNPLELNRRGASLLPLDVGGEREVKKTEETKANKAHANIHHGVRHISYVINETLLRCKKLEKLSTFKSEHKRIKEHISKKDNQFMANCNSEILTKYNSLLTSAPALNVIQQQKGTDTMLQMLGSVKLSQLGVRHLQMVCKEYHERISWYPESKWKICELEKQLQEVIVKEQIRSIAQKTGCTINLISDTELNFESFKPSLCSREECERLLHYIPLAVSSYDPRNFERQDVALLLLFLLIH